VELEEIPRQLTPTIGRTDIVDKTPRIHEEDLIPEDD